MWTTLNFDGRSKTKNTSWRYLQGDPWHRTWRDSSVSLGATLDDGQKIKNNFSSFRDFFGNSRWCHIVDLRMCYKPTKFDKNLWSHFWENQNFLFFLSCELPLILRVVRKRKNELEIFAREPKISNVNEIGQLV